MTELDRKQDRAPVPAAWDYAPAPEARDLVELRDRYGLFVGGDWLEPSETYTTIDPSSEEPLAEVGQAAAEEVGLAVEAARDGVRRRLVVDLALRAREVPVPNRAHPPGALARVRGPRVAERRQADPRVARRRPPALGRALLLLRGLGGQARVRVPEPQAASDRRRRPDRPVELPAAHARLEDRARARRREHGRAQAGRDDAAVGAPLRRRPAPGRAPAGRRQHRHRRRPHRRGARRARRRRQDRVHGLDRGRQVDPARARRHREEAHARARAARPRTSSSTTPRSTRRSRESSTGSTSTRATSAARARGCSSRSRSTSR